MQVGDYPCLCLCLGFSQMIMILPFLLMTLHFSQIGFTDDLTFTVISPFLRSLFPSVLPVYTPKPGSRSENSITGCQYLYIDTLNGHNTSVPTKFAWALYHHYPWKSSIFSTNFLYFFLYFLGIFTKKSGPIRCFTEIRKTRTPLLFVWVAKNHKWFFLFVSPDDTALG